MRLSPTIDDNNAAGAMEVLKAAGAVSKTTLHTPEKVREIFNDNGAGVEDAAKKIGYLMRNADDESLQLRASEMALKVQGIMKDLDGQTAPIINVNIIGSNNQALIQLVTP